MSELHKEDQDRWRELHELLGLPPVEAKEIVPAASPARETAVSPAKSEVAPPSTVALTASSATSAMAAPEVEAPVPSPEIGRELTELADVDHMEVEDAAASPERNRGRRGRRGRPHRDENLAERVHSETPASPADAAEPHVDEADLEDEEVASDEEILEPLAADADEDDETVETFADWNVPSWQDIVASLYRPER